MTFLYLAIGFLSGVAFILAVMIWLTSDQPSSKRDEAKSARREIFRQIYKR